MVENGRAAGEVKPQGFCRGSASTLAIGKAFRASAQSLSQMSTGRWSEMDPKKEHESNLVRSISP